MKSKLWLSLVMSLLATAHVMASSSSSLVDSPDSTSSSSGLSSINVSPQKPNGLSGITDSSDDESEEELDVLNRATRREMQALEGKFTLVNNELARTTQERDKALAQVDKLERMIIHLQAIIAKTPAK